MPTADDDMARNCAKSFCENFLKAGGLRWEFQYVTWIAENEYILINFSCQALLIPQGIVWSIVRVVMRRNDVSVFGIF